jgi:hypothetical protein
MHSRKRLDLVGKVFGNLSVIEIAPSKKVGNKTYSMWRCHCRCGAQIIAEGSKLSRGEKKSCGCLRMEGMRDSTRKRWSANRLDMVDLWEDCL